MMKLRMALLAGVMLTPAIAAAQSYSRVISFGDSLSDNGNLYAVTGGGNPSGGIYFTPGGTPSQRFSNGQVWAEILNGTMITAGPTVLGAPPTPGLLPATANLNFAFGGARTDAAVAVPPGTVTQIGNYTALGGTFSRTDLVTLWAGANDIFQAPSTQAGVGAAATAAGTNVGTQVGTIAAAGAGTIVTLNLPDLGKAPAYTSQGPLGIQLGSFGSATFNMAWAQSVAAAAAANPQANIIQVPIDNLLSAAAANPAAFGLTNVTAPCVTVPACALGTPATQAGYLFWDTVHPTTAGHRLISAYVSEYVFAPVRAAAVGAVGDVGFWTRRQSMADMMDRTTLAAPKGEKPEFFVSIIGETGERNVTSFAGGFSGGAATMFGSFAGARYAVGGLRFGGFKAINSEWTIGGALSATTGEGKAGTVSFRPTTFAADLVGRWQRGGVFVNLGVGAEVNRYLDIERASLVPGLSNKADAAGYGASAVAEAGYRMTYGAFGIVPKARLAYIVSTMDGFTETGFAAPVAFGSRTISALAAGGEVRIEAKLGGALAHALVGYEGFLGSSGGRLNGQLAGNTARPFSVRMSDPVSPGLLLGAGVDATFGGWKAGAAYRATIGAKSQVTHRGQVTVSTSF
jgi:outer membrane lipase/esterase